VIAIVAGHQFAAAASILAVQGFALAATFVSVVWSYGLLALGLHRSILVLNGAVLALAAVLISLLVHFDGAHGAAIGTVACEAVGAVGAAALVIRGRPALRPSLRVVPRVALATGLACLPLLLTDIPVIVRLVISSSLYLLTVLLTGAVPAELYALLPRRWRR